MKLEVDSKVKIIDFPNDSKIHCYINYDGSLEATSGYFMNIL